MDVEKLRKTLNYIIGQEPFDTTWTVSTRHLLRLVNDAVEEEREACAKVCDHWPYGRDDVWSLGQAIRARSNHD